MGLVLGLRLGLAPTLTLALALALTLTCSSVDCVGRVILEGRAREQLRAW